MDLLDWFVGAAGIAGLSMILFGGYRRAWRVRRQNPLHELQHEQQRTARSPQGLVREVELRLYDYGRSVEARIENQLTTLDLLIVEADREIARLEGLLAESRQDWLEERVLTADEQQRCFALLEAGLTAEETARCLHTSPEAVRAALDEWGFDDRRAA